jgi:hypothetical protein
VRQRHNDGCDFFALTYVDVENHEQGCFFGGFHFPAGASTPTALSRTLFTAPNRIIHAISSLAEKGMAGGFAPTAPGDLDADEGLPLASPQRRPRPDATTTDDAADASLDGTTDAGLRQLAKRARTEAPRASSSHSAHLAAPTTAAEMAIPDTDGADGADDADGADGADAFATLAAPATTAAGADVADGADGVDGAA